MGLFKRQLQSSGLCRLDNTNCNNSERSSRRFIKTATTNEAPYQTLGQWSLAATIGHKELTTSHFWVSILSECLSCYLYVFIVCSTRISWTGSIIGHEPNLLAMALASGITMMLLILTFRSVHVNPALTISFLLTGRIPIIRTLAYILVHCLSAIAAIAFLYSISIDGHAGALGLDNPHPSLEMWQILIVEFVISFVVTMVTYTACSYSSYTSARKLVLEQAGQHCTIDLFATLTRPSNCDNHEPSILGTTHTNGPLVSSVTMHHNRLQQQQQQQQLHHQRQATAALASSLATGPRRPLSTSNNNNNNFRIHPQNKTYIPSDNAYENSDDYDEYENHRMYINQLQQYNSEGSPVNKYPPIEEVMQDECQLLAPNGYSLHITRGQALVIGLAYTLASLTGIPASGASLNPARSLGPAFIMNRWENHWIYWVGPILGAIVAGFFYEFIFNPTRSSSVCYLPKLFRLSAQDMAKVGSKSRLYQQQQQQQQLKLSPSGSGSNGIFQSMATAPDYRAQSAHHLSTMHHSPTTRQHQQANNLMSNSTLLNPTLRDHKQQQQQLIAHPTTLAHLQSNHFISNNMDFLQQQQQQPSSQQFAVHEATNFDNRSKSIINLMASKQHQSTMNMPQRNGNFHSNSTSNGSNSQDFGKFATSFRGLQDQSQLPFSSSASKPAFSEL